VILLRSRFYQLFLLFLAGCAGWLLVSLSGIASQGFTICLFKNATGLACPACGSTRSVSYLLQGELMMALQTNPVGLLTAGLMFISGMLFLFDLLQGTSLLEKSAFRLNNFLRNPAVFGFFIVLISANWVWNILKGL